MVFELERNQAIVAENQAQHYECKEGWNTDPG